MSVAERAVRGAVPIRGGGQQVIGTGAVVGLGLVVTALHVVDVEPTGALRVADQLPVAAVVGLPLRRFGRPATWRAGPTTGPATCAGSTSAPSISRCSRSPI